MRKFGNTFLEGAQALGATAGGSGLIGVVLGVIFVGGRG